MSTVDPPVKPAWPKVDFANAASRHANTLVEQSVHEAQKLAGAVDRGNAVLASTPLTTIDTTHPHVNSSSSVAPQLNKRALGWLKFMWRKSTTPDDWSGSGEPHEWWDRYTGGPMTNFPRFDLVESAYALVLMADKTPAWREVLFCLTS